MSWNEQIDKSLRKICHYQQNVPQHYYLLDALVLFHPSNRLFVFALPCHATLSIIKGDRGIKQMPEMIDASKMTTLLRPC